MTYRVFWAPHAESLLEIILRDEEAQARYAAAAREIDKQLAADPISFGESRYDDFRIAFEHPLGIDYEVLQDVRTVIVYNVWRVQSKRGK